MPRRCGGYPGLDVESLGGQLVVQYCPRGGVDHAISDWRSIRAGVDEDCQVNRLAA